MTPKEAIAMESIAAERDHLRAEVAKLSKDLENARKK